MNTSAKIVGIETEYGITPCEGFYSPELVREFFEFSCDDPIRWDYGMESPTKDARDLTFSSGLLSESSTAGSTADRQTYLFPKEEETSGPDDTFTLSIVRDLSTHLPNGARFYIDHAHPEYCTPECATAREVVAHDKAGEQFLMDMVQRYNEACEPDRQIILYKNNSDHQGHSYGCHENYLLAASVYENLFNNKAHWLYTYLLPYLVSRQIFCGAGKVGGEFGTEGVDYQLSQRADFFETVLGLQTTYKRPIINTRDEPHANPARWRRLHVICGDANMAEWSTYLKIGVTQLVLTMLEAGAMRLEHDVTLADPLGAFKAISQDPTLKAPVQLEQRRRRYTALEIQKVFLKTALDYLESDDSIHDRWLPIWEDWARVIYQLETKPEALDQVLDWRIKWKFLQSQVERKGLTWQHPMARELDVKYHQLDQNSGFFYLLQRAGQVDYLLKKDEVERARAYPPVTTRAYLRGFFTRHYSKEILSINWEKITFLNHEDNAKRLLQLPLPNPTAYNEDEISAVLKQEHGIVAIIAQLTQLKTLPEAVK